MSTTRLLVPAFVAFAAAGALAAAPPDQQPPAPPVFRGAVDAVLVDVIVTDEDGRPITDLTRDDFEVTEDGKPQAIEQFSVVRVERNPSRVPMAIRSVAQEEIEAQRQDVRLFVIYSAVSYIGREAAERVLEPLVDFVESLPPTDMVAIVDDWTPLSAMMLTRDRDEVIRGIRRLADEEVRDRRQMMLLNRDLLDNPGAPDPIRGLEAVSNRLASLRDGRQTIIYLGSGIWSRGGNRDLDLSLLIGTLNRNNTAVYVVDPSGLRPGRTSSSIYDLRALAEETGGRALVNTNRVGEALATVAEDASFYYLLGYTSAAGPDGKFHKIRVAVRRPDVVVRARSGFKALTKELITSKVVPVEVPQPVERALAAIAAPVNAARAIRTWLGIDRNEQGRPRVTLVWEPAGGTEARAQAVKVGVEAKSSDGTVLFAGTSPGDEGAAAPSSGAARRAHQVVFDAPPGNVTVRLSVESSEGPLDTEVHSIRVPDPSAPDASVLSTPRVHAARTVPQLRAMLADPAAIPATVREFARTDRVFIRVTTYATDASPRASLLNTLGQKMMDLAVAPASAGGTHQIEVALTSVPPGEYLVEIAAGAGSAAELVPFRIR